MKKTIFTMAASVLVLSTVLSACGTKSADGTSTPAAGTATPAATKAPVKNVTLSLRHIAIKDSDKKFVARLTDAVKEAEASMPGLHIEVEGMEEQVHRFQKLRAEMSAGNPPQIFYSFGGTDTKDFVKTGNILDLTPILAELGLQDKFNSLDEFTVDGKVYGLPLAGYAEGVFYNKKMFADNGLKVPTTWDEFLKVCETLKSKKITPIALAGKDAWVINMLTNTLWVHSAGIDAIPGVVAGTNKWTDADLADGFKKLEELTKKKYFNDGALAIGYDEQKNKFAKGEAAMSVDGSWSGGWYSDPATSKVAADVGFFTFPNFGGKGDNTLNASFSAGFSFSAKLNDDEKAGVKAFIKAMYDDKQQIRANEEEGWLPSKKLQLTNAKPVTNEILNSFSGKKAFPAFDSIIQAKAREAIESGVQEIIGGKSTADKVAAKVQTAQEAANKEKK
jgi:raffinose/stachyose/melibiose transport system substrate-binding protein